MVDPLEYALAAVDVAVYAVLALQLRSARRPPAGPLSLADAFRMLGAQVRTSIPDVPPGFTWGEAMARARKLGLDVDWPKVERAVQTYEGYRYGGKEEPKQGTDEIRALVEELRRAR